MVTFLSIIFISVFIIVNRMFLSPFETGTLILLTMLVCVIEYNLYCITRYLKNGNTGQSTEGSGK